MSSDLPGVNPATLNDILIYYHLMTKRSGLGDSTELSRVGLSQYIVGVCRILSRFGSRVSPHIHVKSMCRRVIHQGLPLLD
jgi:hypothetical protein